MKVARLPSCSRSFTNASAALSTPAYQQADAAIREPSVRAPPLDPVASYCCTRLVKQAFGKNLTVGLSTALLRSARSLGAGHFSVFRFVHWPAIRPGLLAGGVLGFAVSFDDVVLSLFMQGPNTVTLPVRMFTAIEYDLTPKIAASASVFIALAVLGLLVHSLGTARRTAA